MNGSGQLVQLQIFQKVNIAVPKCCWPALYLLHNEATFEWFWLTDTTTGLVGSASGLTFLFWIVWVFYVLRPCQASCH